MALSSKLIGGVILAAAGTFFIADAWMEYDAQTPWIQMNYPNTAGLEWTNITVLGNPNQAPYLTLGELIFFLVGLGLLGGGIYLILGEFGVT